MCGLVGFIDLKRRAAQSSSTSFNTNFSNRLFILGRFGFALHGHFLLTLATQALQRLELFGKKHL